MLSRRACRRHRRKHLALCRVGRRAPAVSARMADEDAPAGKGLDAPPAGHLRQHVQRGAERPHASAAGIGDHPRFGVRMYQPVRAPPSELRAIPVGLSLVGRGQDQNVKRVRHNNLHKTFALPTDLSPPLSCPASFGVRRLAAALDSGSKLPHSTYRTRYPSAISLPLPGPASFGVRRLAAALDNGSLLPHPTSKSSTT